MLTRDIFFLSLFFTLLSCYSRSQTTTNDLVVEQLSLNSNYNTKINYITIAPKK